MQKIPPSDEVLDQISNVVKAAMTSPDEEVLAIAAFVIVEGPSGPMGRSVIHPPDAADSVAKILWRQLAGEESQPWHGE
jgi:hypothetical protein